MRKSLLILASALTLMLSTFAFATVGTWGSPVQDHVVQVGTGQNHDTAAGTSNQTATSGACTIGAPTYYYYTTGPVLPGGRQVLTIYRQICA